MKIHKRLATLFISLFLLSCSGSNDGNSGMTIRLFQKADTYINHVAIIDEKQEFSFWSKTGYDFVGYFDANDTQYSDELGHSLKEWKSDFPDTLYAKYEPKEYTIELNLGGGALSYGDTSFKVTYDTDISSLPLEPPYKEKHTFLGYYVGDGESSKRVTDSEANFLSEAKIFNDSFYPIKEDSQTLSFTALYSESEVEFYMVDLNRKITFKQGASIDSFPYTIQDNHCFVGFYYDSEYQKRVEFPLLATYTGQVTSIYARYEKGTEKGLSYSFDTADTYIASYVGSAEKVFVPDSYMGKLVTRIGSIEASMAEIIVIPQTVTNINEGAFKNSAKAKEIILSDKVNVISKECFANCKKLEKVRLNDAITEIGEYAFFHCESLKSIILPAHLESIAKTSLIGTVSLENIAIDGDNEAYFVEEGVLYLKKSPSSYSLLKYPNAKEGYSYRINAKTSTICEYAFSYSKLRKVEAGSSLISIEEGAFMNSASLNCFKVLETPTLDVYKWAFVHCPMLASIVFDVTSMVVLSSDNVFEGSYEGLKVFVPNATYFSYVTDYHWSKTSVDLMRMTMIFGDYCIDTYSTGVKIIAYFGDDKKVVIPNYLNGKSVLAIGGYAFIFNEFIEELELNQDLELIQDHAFIYCGNLKNIYVNGDTLKSIEGEPFDLGVSIFIRNDSQELLDAYKRSWEAYKDSIWTAN